MACIAIPRHTINRMEGLMRSFLWNQRGQNWIHWVTWKKITKPLSEGGLGIHSLSDKIYGLHGKLAWRLLSGNSLWASLIMQKYGALTGSAQYRTNSSRLWNALNPHFQQIHLLSHWQVGRGDIPFWMANWLGEALNPESTSTLTVLETILRIETIQEGVNSDSLLKIQDTVLDVEAKDRLVFSPSKHGRFSVKEYLKQALGSGTNINCMDLIWNPFTYRRVNSFMWRLYWGGPLGWWGDSKERGPVGIEVRLMQYTATRNFETPFHKIRFS